MSSTPSQKSTVGHGTRDITHGAGGRRTPRRAYRRPVGILVQGRYEVLDGRGLSEGGVLVALGDGANRQFLPKMVTDDLPVGAKVAVSLILPAGPMLILRGEIIYHEGDDKTGHTVGIKFDGVPLNQRREIRNYVSSKQAGESSLN